MTSYDHISFLDIRFGRLICGWRPDNYKRGINDSINIDIEIITQILNIKLHSLSET